MRDYDPGSPWDEEPPRRKRREWEHPDDAWAAADEDGAPPGDYLDIEDFAAGYVADDTLKYGVHNPNPPDMDDDAGLGHLPRPPRRSGPPRYVDDANFQPRFRTSAGKPAGVGSLRVTPRGLFEVPDTRPQSARRATRAIREPVYQDDHPAGGVPFWAIVMLVVLGIVSLAVVVLVFEWVMMAVK